ncbi:arsenate reductase (glutaredoxin) [Halocynthiibacter styelae]|uniref:Arsenate reductase n=1 Tax=Halocynthiibacter styelae TaxID=2761955 RepID=A0A8J7J3G3_9RHOB|nr:arsenate reductase (glutaredoxin) [Paenihalocynthiibacter styelae]MBI1492510.1 arsenate reductase (glutaredoxin) [Paenihalocynthiibacter styelae]
MAVTEIWHNPRCSKSRQTLAILEERGIAPQIRLYLQDGPDEATLRAVLTELDKTPAEIMRVKDALFKDLGLNKDTAPDDLIRAMVANPALIERPIVRQGGKARMGRPPEDVLEII